MSEEVKEESKPRGRKPKAEVEEVKPNIENLAALAAEFVQGTRDKMGKKIPMPERKLIALRVKLISLFNEGIITPDEQALMERILKKDRSIGRIASADEYLLNSIEASRLTGTCIVKSDDTPQVHHLYKGLECKFYYDDAYNDNKGKPDSIGRYFVYVPREVPTRHQLKISTVMKENLGHPTDPSEYPLPRTLIHRIGLKEKEFERWFEVEDAGILDSGLVGEEQEEEYQF